MTVKAPILSAVGFIGGRVTAVRAVAEAFRHIRRMARTGGTMVCTRRAAFPAAVTMACLLATTAGGALQSKCLVTKNKCMAKTVASMLKCYEKAETPGQFPDPNHDACLGKAQDKFDGDGELKLPRFRGGVAAFGVTASGSGSARS
jgi:hypothetical protein